MKLHIFPYATVLTLSLLIGACAEDNGNYNYKSINKVTIATIDDQFCEAGAHLTITPDLTIFDESSINLTYSWTIGTKEVSTERNLDIDLPALSYDNKHICALTIKDKDTGMQYRQTFTLTVANPFNYGYYFLTRKNDGSTEMAYIQSKKTDDSTIDDVKYTTGVAEYPFGNEPKQIYGVYGTENKIDRWQFTFITQEGENPVIITDNNTFIPTSLVTRDNFIEQDKGYIFKPETTITSSNKDVGQFFISNGQFIRYANGKLYRPSRHLQEYYWSNPVIGDRGAKFAWVYDELTKRYYTLQAYTSDIPEEGIIADSYAYDNVIEPTNNQEIKGNIIFSEDKLNGSNHSMNVYIADTEGIKIYNFKRTWDKQDPAFVSETLLPLSGTNEKTTITSGIRGLSNSIFYVNGGNEIYSSPIILPKLTPFITIPSDLGNIEKMGLSALGNRLIVVLYDENSTEERKGSVVFVDIATKKITHTFPHILHHCVSLWGANDSTSLWGYDQYGDGK